MSLDAQRLADIKLKYIGSASDASAAEAEALQVNSSGEELAIPNPVIHAAQIGTAATVLYDKSANTLYVLSSIDQPIADGIQVVTGGDVADDDWSGDLIVRADVAASAIRYEYKVHGSKWIPMRSVT
jgi:hypothetical protein